MQESETQCKPHITFRTHVCCCYDFPPLGVQPRLSRGTSALGDWLERTGRPGTVILSPCPCHGTAHLWRLLNFALAQSPEALFESMQLTYRLCEQRVDLFAFAEIISHQCVNLRAEDSCSTSWCARHPHPQLTRHDVVCASIRIHLFATPAADLDLYSCSAATRSLHTRARARKLEGCTDTRLGGG